MARPTTHLGEKSDRIRELVGEICELQPALSKNGLIRLSGMLAQLDGKSAHSGRKRAERLLYGPALTEKGARRLLGLLHVAVGPGGLGDSRQKVWRKIHEIDALLPRGRVPFGNYEAQPCIVFFPRDFTSEIAALWRKEGLREATVQRAGKILYRELRKRSERFEQDFEYFTLTDEEHDVRAANDYYEVQAPREDIAARWAAQEAGESEYWSEIRGRVVKIPFGSAIKRRRGRNKKRVTRR